MCGNDSPQDVTSNGNALYISFFGMRVRAYFDIYYSAVIAVDGKTHEFPPGKIHLVAECLSADEWSMHEHKQHLQGGTDGHTVGVSYTECLVAY